MALEREIKLPFPTPDAARASVVACGATPLHPRRLQHDAILDTDDQRVWNALSVLRVRADGDDTRLTFKGPALPGVMKMRDEHETVVADRSILLAILDGLGYRIRFRYEKYREEFAAEGLVVAVDETPVGTFVELEGDEASIHLMAAKLGFSPADYVLESYRAIFLRERAAQGLAARDMLFADMLTP